MRREMALGVVVGLLWGTALWAAGATFRPQSSGTKETAARGGVALPQEVRGEKPLSHYRAIEERNLFQPAIRPSPPKPETRIVLPSFPREVVAPVWQSPTVGWTYAGYASLDGVMVAILQESSSGEAVFLRQGETFRGGEVEEITPSSVRVAFPSATLGTSGEKVELLPRSDEYNTVPLNAPSEERGAVPVSRPAMVTPRGGPMFPFFRGGEGRPIPANMARSQEEAARLREMWAARRAQMLERLNRPVLPAEGPQMPEAAVNPPAVPTEETSEATP